MGKWIRCLMLDSETAPINRIVLSLSVLTIRNVFDELNAHVKSEYTMILKEIFLSSKIKIDDMDNEEAWIKMQLERLTQKTTHYTELEKNNYSEGYLRNALLKIPALITTEADQVLFKAEIEELIQLFPVRNDQGKFDANVYSKKLSTFKASIQKKYNLVAKRYHISIWLPLGISIGLPFGLIFKNIALGIPIGLVFGVAVGSFLDRKAEKEGRVL